MKATLPIRLVLQLGRDRHPENELISIAFEKAIANYALQGYELESWKYNTISTPTTIADNIIAVFVFCPLFAPEKTE